jgi:tRNA A-37 threonylcarbamoyl transferase component Bud32
MNLKFNQTKFNVPSSLFKADGWKVFCDDIPDVDNFIAFCCIRNKHDVSEFEPVNSSKVTKVFRFKWNSQEYYYKEYLFQNVWKHRKIIRRGSHLKHIAGLLEKSGFETPKIVCYGRSGTRVFVVCDAAKFDSSVYDILVNKADSAELDIVRFRAGFGEEIGRLHTSGFVHGDLRWGNILVRGAESERPIFIFIDNDRTRKYRRIPARLRIKNLVQMKYPGSLLDRPESNWDDIWRGYISGNEEALTDAKNLRRRVDRKNARRVTAWWKKPRNRQLLKEREARKSASGGS